MTDLTDRTISSLRAHHDTLAALAESLTDEQLEGPSGASEWTIAQVLSHLGSQAEISLIPLKAAVDGVATPASDNKAIWDRWDSATPREQATGFIEHGARYQETLEALSEEQRATIRVDLGFLPDPVKLSTAVGMRLNEVAQHAWDIEVGVDPAAEVDETSAVILIEHLAGELAFMLGFTAKPDLLDEVTTVSIGDHALVVDDEVAIRAGGQETTAAFTGPSGALVRLIGGRLAPERTPAGVEVTGNVSLDDLRSVFPGF